MAAAVLEAGIRPDVVLGSSIGALNGAMVAADPTEAGAMRLRLSWEQVENEDLLSSGMFDRIRTAARQRVSTHDTDEMRRIVSQFLPTDRFDELVVPFQCVAASIERSAEHWFDSGSLVEAILASSAIPVLFPPVVIDGESFYDGGLVNSVPVDRAVQLGARRIFVFQVGRIEQPLRPPTRRHEPALLAFEIARRHRFSRAVESLPADTEMHLLPSGNILSFDDTRQLKWRDTSDTASLIQNAYTATSVYMADVLGAR